MIKIKDLKEHDHGTQPWLIKSCTKGVTSKGQPYLNLVLQDHTGTMDGKFWNVSEKDMEEVHAGHVAEVNFEVLSYKDNLQLRVNHVRKMDESLVHMEDFVLTGKYNKAQLQSEMEGYISSLVNPVLKQLVKGVLLKTGECFYEYPAASSIHHNYMGGLAEHTLGMARLADYIASQYPILNRDLLIAGVLVHDVGKTRELGGLISSEYSLEGKLTGHISIGHGMLMEVAQEEGLEDKEETVLLRHMILSHHGKYEFGSPILPEIPEAECLNLIDNIDARMNTLAKTLDGVKPGNWSQRIFALENRQFYKAKQEKES